MNTVPKILVSLGWSMLCAAVVTLLFGTVQTRFGFSSKPAVKQTSTQGEEALTSQLVNALRSPTDEVRVDAQKKLIAIARTSAAKRESVMNQLLSAVNAEKELDGTHTILKTSLSFWESVTVIFTELDATEAVDVLIRCVHCNNGYSGNMGEPPAAYALVQMGKPILPKLSIALSKESDPYKRAKIVVCVARIGGPEAISHLEHALRSESDREVRKIIKFNLAEMKSNN